MKAGDLVRVKSWKELEKISTGKTFTGSLEFADTDVVFNELMKSFCGKTFTVDRIEDDHVYFKKGGDNWIWLEQFLEVVNPVVERDIRKSVVDASVAMSNIITKCDEVKSFNKFVLNVDCIISIDEANYLKEALNGQDWKLAIRYSLNLKLKKQMTFITVSRKKVK